MTTHMYRSHATSPGSSEKKKGLPYIGPREDHAAHQVANASQNTSHLGDVESTQTDLGTQFPSIHIYIYNIYYVGFYCFDVPGPGCLTMGCASEVCSAQCEDQSI